MVLVDEVGESSRLVRKGGICRLGTVPRSDP